jgi:hypothetical protein
MCTLDYMKENKSVTRTPVSSDSNKRELSLPFDHNKTKKVRSLSENSEMDEPVTHILLCDEDLMKISSFLKSTLQTKLSTMVSDVINSVLSNINS